MTTRLPDAEPAFDPDACAVCGSDEAAIAFERHAPSFASDGRVIDEPIVKVECLACGAVRRGTTFDADALARHYHDNYALGRRAAAAEPIFFDKGRATPRSLAMFDWLSSEVCRCGNLSPRAFAEIGCGDGAVLARFRTMWPAARAVGLEWNRADADAARNRGLDVHCAPYGALSGMFDVIYAVAVIEHVPSPAHFLAALRAQLTANGLLLIAYPALDVGSRDLLFVDHLHHLGDAHLAHLGAAAGLATVRSAPGTGPLAAFRLHVFRRVETIGPPNGVPLRPSVSSRATFDRWQRRFARLDEWLAALDRPPIVWGLGEGFGLLSAYSGLSACRIELGLDDNPTRFAGDVLPFPVCSLEDASDDALRDARVLLTFSCTPAAARRLEHRSLPWFDAMSEAVYEC